MKAILIIAAILALLFGLGWMSFASNDGNTSVTIDRSERSFVRKPLQLIPQRTRLCPARFETG